MKNALMIIGRVNDSIEDIVKFWRMKHKNKKKEVLDCFG